MKLKNIKFKQAVYSIIMTAIVTAVLLIINLISETAELQFDMTDKGIFSLSQETETLAENLEHDVIIYALYKPGKESKQIQLILDLYSEFNKISVEIIDPDRNPALLNSFQSENKSLTTGSLIVQSGSYWQVIEEIDLYNINYSEAGPQIFGLKAEQNITSALAYVKTGPYPSPLQDHYVFLYQKPEIPN